jgi:hypothetical protein
MSPLRPLLLPVASAGGGALSPSCSSQLPPAGGGEEEEEASGSGSGSGSSGDDDDGSDSASGGGGGGGDSDGDGSLASFDAELADMMARADSPQAQARESAHARANTRKTLTRCVRAQGGGAAGAPAGAGTPAARTPPAAHPHASLATSAAKTARPCQRQSPLACLPPELLLHVLKWLSADDLCALAASCAPLRAAASEPSHWRRLYTLRWPDAAGMMGTMAANGAAAAANWRARLFQRDAEELAGVDAGSPLRALYVQMLFARRSEAPSRAVVDADAARAAAEEARGAPAALAAWRRRNAVSSADGSSAGGAGAASTPHRCSARSCVFERLPTLPHAPPLAVCVATGRAHACDDDCREERPDGSGEVSVLCALTGAVRAHFYEQTPLTEGADGHNAAAAEMGDDGGGFLPGTFGRAYTAGYECATESELRAAMWGVAGVKRPSSGHRGSGGGDDGGGGSGSRRRASR